MSIESWLVPRSSGRVLFIVDMCEYKEAQQYRTVQYIHVL